MSVGPSGSSINATTTATPALAAGLTRGLLAADRPAHRALPLAYNEKRVEFDPARIAADWAGGATVGSSD